MSLHFEVLTPHLWTAKCRGYAMNTGILYDAGLAALIDPALLPDEVEDIAAFCEVQQLKVETVVLTHHHWTTSWEQRGSPVRTSWLTRRTSPRPPSTWSGRGARYDATRRRKVLWLMSRSTRPCLTRPLTTSSGSWSGVSVSSWFIRPDMRAITSRCTTPTPHVCGPETS